MFDLDKYLEALPDRAAHVKEYPGVRSKWYNVFEEMIVHTRGIKPVKILNTTRPNEPPSIKQYRIDNFEPITQDGIEKGIDRTTRIFSSANYKIEPTSTVGEFLEKDFDILDEDTNDKSNFKEFMFSNMLRVMVEDPNGALCWWPVNAEDPHAEPIDNPPEMKIDVEPKIVWSEEIVDFTNQVLCFTDGEWTFTYRDKNNKEQTSSAPYYYTVTKKEIWRTVPVRYDAKGRLVYESTLYYDLGEGWELLPAILLKGVKVATHDNYVYYQSFFNSYVGPANEAIRAYTDDQAVAVQCAYPVVSVKGQKCYKCDGVKRYKDGKDHEGKSIWHTCEVCNGTGETASLSPHMTYIKKPPTSGEDPQWSLSPAVEFNSPPTDILDYTMKRWETWLDRAERSINVKFSEDAQSGISKDKDLEQMMDMLAKISANIFRIIRLSLDILENYLVVDPSKRQESIVIEPTEFRIKTQMELLDELNSLKEKKAPQSFVYNAAVKLSKELYHGDPIRQKVVRLSGLWDKLFGMSLDDIMKLKTAGGVDSLDVVRHANAFNILTKLSQDKGFLDAQDEQILEQAEALLPEVQVPTPLFTNGFQN